MTMSVLLWLGAHLLLHNLWIFLTVLLTKGLVLFGLAYAATKLFRSLPAEYKHTMWFVIILGFVLLPMGRLLVPVVPVPLPDLNGVSPFSRLVAVPVAYSERVISIIDAPRLAAPGGAAGAARRLLLLLPVSLWLAGVVFFLMRYVAGRVALRRLAKTCAVSPPHRHALAELVKQMGIRREVSVVCSSRCAIPLTYNWLHPRIVLPEVSRTWSAERLRAVLIHELTHIKRSDCLSNAVVYLVCAFLWFNPIAWLARELMLGEAEMTCDRSVLTTGMRGTEYASAIVDIVRAAQGNILFPGAYGFLGRKSLLKERILRVLAPGSGSPASSLFRTGKALLFCIALLLPLLAITYSLGAGEKLYGMWVQKGVAGYYKFSWNADGRGQQYDKTAPNDPCNEGEFIIEKQWSDPKGNTWYNLKAKWSSMPVPWYALISVDRSGKICEFDASYSGYPQEFSGPAGTGNHQLYVKQ
jgi:beta-lactamase regulating signal transducer with metallopeptidase domain